jgi:hypothetical protein
MCKELLRLLEVHEKQPATVAAIFFALRAIACNDDAVQQVFSRVSCDIRNFFCVQLYSHLFMIV